MAKKSYLSEKEVVPVSSITTERYREPASPRIAANMTQFVFDHKRQTAHIPDRDPHALVEASLTGRRTQGPGRTVTKFTSTNRSGRTAALGALAHADLGGTPDEPGRFQRKG
jgi:hypothetical protein